MCQEIQTLRNREFAITAEAGDSDYQDGSQGEVRIPQSNHRQVNRQIGDGNTETRRGDSEEGSLQDEFTDNANGVD